MAKAELDMVKLASQLTMQVRVKRMNEWRVRLRLGLLLIRLAARVMGVGISMEDENG